MLFLRGVDNWKIYTVIHQPEHQRTEMLYQAWLGGLDRPYSRPKCMAHQPLWLTKRRHELRKNRLDGAETTLEKFVLEWYKKYFSFQGTERPDAEELHTVFDLVASPLDLSYACQLLRQCRNRFNVALAEETFIVFLEACLRVDRKDVATYALENAEDLGFRLPIDKDAQKYLAGEQTWYKVDMSTGEYLPLDENRERNGQKQSSSSSSSSSTASVDGVTTTKKTKKDAAPPAEEVDDEIAKLQAELDALERGDSS